MRITGGLCAAALSLAATALAGCGDDGASGAGSVAFSTWGEEYIEQEIPAADLEDGWSIRYEKFLFVLRDVTVADREGNAGARMEGSILFDHTKPGVKPVVTFEGLEAKPWERVSYEIGPADADTALDGATEEDKALMLAAGASVHIEAIARKAGGGDERRLDWTFSLLPRRGRVRLRRPVTGGGRPLARPAALTRSRPSSRPPGARSRRTAAPARS